MITFTHPPSYGIILEPDEAELLRRLVRAYRACPAADDIPVLDRLDRRLS